MKYSNGLFCPKPKDNPFTIKSHREKLEILSVELQYDVWSYCTEIELSKQLAFMSI